MRFPFRRPADDDGSFIDRALVEAADLHSDDRRELLEFFELRREERALRAGLRSDPGSYLLHKQETSAPYLAYLCPHTAESTEPEPVYVTRGEYGTYVRRGDQEGVMSTPLMRISPRMLAQWFSSLGRWRD